jgi:hypothetical protein
MIASENEDEVLVHYLGIRNESIHGENGMAEWISVGFRKVILNWLIYFTARMKSKNNGGVKFTECFRQVNLHIFRLGFPCFVTIFRAQPSILRRYATIHVAVKT